MMQTPMLFGIVVFLCSVATYLLPDPVNEGKSPLFPRSQDMRWMTWLIARSVGIGLLCFLLSGRNVTFSIAILACCFVLPYLRRYVISNYFGAELELTGICTLLLVVNWMVAAGRITPHLPRVAVPINESKLCAVLLIASLTLAMLRGGTYVVRGILKRTESLPRKAQAKGMEDTNGTLDETEINRGRIIGNLERIILMIVVAKGSYEALGFLIAAKGLIRSEHFNNRDWAEYFLIGSLCSVLIALIAGWTVGIVLRTYWV